MNKLTLTINVLVFIGVGLSFLYMIPSHSVFAETTQVTSAKDKDMQPFFFILLIVGGCIALTLSYVSWRKYKAEKNKKKQEGNNEE